MDGSGKTSLGLVMSLAHRRRWMQTEELEKEIKTTKKEIKRGDTRSKRKSKPDSAMKEKDRER